MWEWLVGSHTAVAVWPGFRFWEEKDEELSVCVWWTVLYSGASSLDHITAPSPCSAAFSVSTLEPS